MKELNVSHKIIEKQCNENIIEKDRKRLDMTKEEYEKFVNKKLITEKLKNVKCEYIDVDYNEEHIKSFIKESNQSFKSAKLIQKKSLNDSFQMELRGIILLGNALLIKHFNKMSYSHYCQFKYLFDKKIISREIFDLIYSIVKFDPNEELIDHGFKELLEKKTSQEIQKTIYIIRIKLLGLLECK